MIVLQGRVVTAFGDAESLGTEVAAPAGLPRTDGAFVKVSLSATGAQPGWNAPADLYFRSRDGEWQLVGFERIPVR